MEKDQSNKCNLSFAALPLNNFDVPIYTGKPKKNLNLPKLHAAVLNYKSPD